MLTDKPERQTITILLVQVKKIDFQFDPSLLMEDYVCYNIGFILCLLIEDFQSHHNHSMDMDYVSSP